MLQTRRSVESNQSGRSVHKSLLQLVEVCTKNSACIKLVIVGYTCFKPEGQSSLINLVEVCDMSRPLVYTKVHLLQTRRSVESNQSG